MIQEDFYHHPRVVALAQEGKHLFSYLCGNSHDHYSGLYFLPIRDIAQELALPENDVAYWLRILDAGPVEFSEKISGGREKWPGGFGYLAEYDWERQIVWVRGMLKRRTKPGSLTAKHKAGLQKYLIRFVNSPLLPRFLSCYAAFGIPHPNGYPNPHSDGDPNRDQGTLPLSPSGYPPGYLPESKVLRFEG